MYQVGLCTHEVMNVYASIRTWTIYSIHTFGRNIMPILCCFSEEVYSQCSSRRERTNNDGGGGRGREDAG